MKPYQLRKGSETVEVLPGREARRDFLMRRGYEWINADEGADAQTEAPAQNAEDAQRSDEAEAVGGAFRTDGPPVILAGDDAPEIVRVTPLSKLRKGTKSEDEGRD